MTIAEVSRTFHLSIETLRYYERISLIPKVHRKANGYREYTDEDIKWIYYAKVLRAAGVSIEAMTKYIALARQGDDTVKERLAILTKQKEEMEERVARLEEALSYIRIKIGKCQTFLETGERKPVEEEYHLFQAMKHDKKTASPTEAVMDKEQL